MVELIGVAFISSAGWLIALVSRRSAALRHLVLLSSLVACLLLPVLIAVRARTNWKVVAIPAPASGITYENSHGPQALRGPDRNAELPDSSETFLPSSF